MKSIFLLPLIVLLLFIANCSPVRLVKPLKEGEKAIGANLGGPLINFGGAPIPIPYTAAFGAKGINDKTTAFASLHLTALSFGVLQTDIGLCRQLWESKNKTTGFTVNPALQLALDRWEWQFRCWPQLDLQAYHTFQNQSMVYAGFGNWFELNPNRPHGEKQSQFWFGLPHAGYRWGKQQWQYGLEGKLVAPGVVNTPNVVDYIGVNGKGAVGIYFNVMRRF